MRRRVGDCDGRARWLTRRGPAFWFLGCVLSTLACNMIRAGALADFVARGAYGTRHSVAVWGVITMYAARDWR